MSAGIGAIADIRLQNIAVLRTSGIYVLAKYDASTPRGTIRSAIDGTYLLRYAAAQTRDSPMISVLNTIGNPVNTRARGIAAWEEREHSGFCVVTSLNFTNSYRDTSSHPNRGIASFTAVDLQFSYEFDPADGGLQEGTQGVPRYPGCPESRGAVQ